MSADRAILPVHRHAWEIPHMLIGAGQLVKKRRFATVLITCQGKRQDGAIRQWVFLRLCMVFSTFSESRVIDRARHRNPMFLFVRCFGSCLAYILNLYLLCIRQAQRQFIAMNPHLNRIAHRRIFYHRNRCSRNQSHIQKMMPQCTFSANCPNGCSFSYW